MNMSPCSHSLLGDGWCLTCKSYTGHPSEPPAHDDVLPLPKSLHLKISDFEPPKQGIKFDGGKPALDLIDPHFIEDVGAVMTFGARKYERDNWKRGMAIGKAMGAVLRHCFAIMRGEYLDPETKIAHAAHATCGLMFIHFMVRTGKIDVPDDRFAK